MSSPHFSESGVSALLKWKRRTSPLPGTIHARRFWLGERLQNGAQTAEGGHQTIAALLNGDRPEHRILVTSNIDLIRMFGAAFGAALHT